MILTLDKQNWFFDMLRQFFMALDSVIYSLISWILQGIFELSNVAVNDSFVEIIYKRIYVVLGIFMVFKLTFSFLQYMINPDTLVDKERGTGKLIVRIVVMLCLLVGMPIFFFDDLIEIKHKDGTVEQSTVLDALQEGVLNTLPKLILGSSDAADVAESSKENGEYLATEMFKAFYYPAACDEGEAKADTCEKDAKKLTTLSSISATATQQNTDTGYYTYHYIWPLTTVAGIVLVVILLGFAVDIAVRVFKLILLQVVAPVPIMSYIDPKSSKDGAFNSWIKNFVSTYLDLFIKLGTVYIVLLLCSKLFSNEQDALIEGGIALNGFNEKTFLFVFLTIGLFKFAKDAPKFIKDALGIKDSGGSMFGGLQTLGAAAGLVGGATAGLVGGAAGGIAAAKAAKAAGNKGHGLSRVLGGGLSGLARGGTQGAKGAAKGNLLKGMSGAISAQNAITQRNLAAAAGGSTLFGRMGARADDFFGRSPAIEVADEDAKHLNTASDNLKNLWDYAEGKGFTKLAGENIGTKNSYKDIGGRDVRTVATRAGDHVLFKNAYEKAVSDGLTSMTFRGNTYDMATAGKIYGDFKDQTAEAYLKKVSNGDITDSVVEDRIMDINREIDSVSSGNRGSIGEFSASTINKDSATNVKDRAISIKPSAETLRRHKANREANKRGK